MDYTIRDSTDRILATYPQPGGEAASALIYLALKHGPVRLVSPEGRTLDTATP